MRFLILDTDYDSFLAKLYTEHSALSRAPYVEQMRVRAATCFADGGLYSANLRAVGQDAEGVYVNNEHMQRAWAREHGIRLADTRRRFGLWPRTLRWSSHDTTSSFYEVLNAQIRHYRPDVLFNHDIVRISTEFLQQVKPHVRLLVGQHASPLPKGVDVGVYDLILSSVPWLVDYFRGQGARSELLRLAFEPTVLEHLGDPKGDPPIPVSFVGSVSTAHPSRQKWLEHMCRHVDVDVWTSSADVGPADSAIRSRCRGPAWGIEMYRILRNSLITLNHHIDMAGRFANNLRLYEATGVGTLLVTDWKENLHELFEPDAEVIAYRTNDECVELVRYFLAHDMERARVAKAGQRRTLKDHNYSVRMRELAEIVARYC
jgi:spore maturation protein CgeB